MIGKIIRDGADELEIQTTDKTIASFELFAAEMLKWNRKINLTAITSEKEVAIKHFVDSLYFADQVKNGNTALDIGSGAGIPGIPLAIVRKDISVISVDAVAKKIQFQRHVARLIGLDNFTAIHSRIENLPVQYANGFDLITSRAFSSLEQFVKLAAPLLKDSGRLIAMKGPASAVEISESGIAIKQLGFEIEHVNNYELPENLGKRSLITVRHCNY